MTDVSASLDTLDAWDEHVGRMPFRAGESAFESWVGSMLFLGMYGAVMPGMSVNASYCRTPAVLAKFVPAAASSGDLHRVDQRKRLADVRWSVVDKLKDGKAHFTMLPVPVSSHVAMATRQCRRSVAISWA